ncbi:MAG: phosphate/phosphite/phosphonate ABC transporter substrate-binding protein [Rhodospirillales bacterium]|nr:phosphate/phosphite/phosphonate ABC transporter substrate-binding protein [Rhodospirillales bacterium]
MFSALASKPGAPGRADRAVLCLAIALALALWSGAARAQSASCENPEVLRISIAVQGNPQKQLGLYMPVLDFLSERSGKPVEIFIPRSYGSAVEALRRGWVQVGALSAGAYVKARSEDAGVEPFATNALKPGYLQPEGPGYQVVLISKIDSEIKRLESAKGAVAGLRDQESAAGYHVPRIVFGKLVGQDLESYFSQVLYTGADDLSTMAVFEGKVDVAFVTSTGFDRMVRQEMVRLEDFNVLWRSPPLPENPFVYRAALCEDLKRIIADTFLTLHTQFQARHFLDSFKASRMVPVSDLDYQILRDLRGARIKQPTD